MNKLNCHICNFNTFNTRIYKKHINSRYHILNKKNYIISIKKLLTNINDIDNIILSYKNDLENFDKCKLCYNKLSYDFCIDHYNLCFYCYFSDDFFFC